MSPRASWPQYWNAGARSSVARALRAGIREGREDSSQSTDRKNTIDTNGMTLNEVLRALGMTTEPAGGSAIYCKRVLRADGSLFCEGCVGEVWKALRDGGLIR